jgi:uncharacterized protein YndB with AHSA1/START domain
MSASRACIRKESSKVTQTNVTPDFDRIVSEIDITAPPERVFKAIADAEEVRRRAPVLSAYEMDLRIGGRWRLEMRPPEKYQGVDVIVHDGEILEFDPPRLLVFTWTANFHKDPKHKSIVRWELTPTKSGTHVKLTHSGLASEADAAKAYSGGWPGVLDELKTYVEQRRS